MMTTSLSDVLYKYGFEPDRNGYMKCPFHQEKSASLKIYPDDKGFFCFGCNVGGNAINFIMHLFNLDFKRALEKYKADFGYTKPTFTDYQRVKAKENERTELEKRYWKAFDEWARLEENKRQYAPKNQEEELHPLFIEAIKNEEVAWYRYGCIATEFRNYLNR